MTRRSFSIQNRVFFWTVLLVLISSVLIGVTVVLQYQDQNEMFNQNRLEQKEVAIKRHLEIDYNESSYIGDTPSEKLDVVFYSKIFDIAKIHGLDIQIFDLDGNLILCSIEGDDMIHNHDPISEQVLKTLFSVGDHRFVKHDEYQENEYQTSYVFLEDEAGQPIGILHIPYLEDLTKQERELYVFFRQLSIGFFVMFLIGMFFAYLISSFITKSIKTISEKIKKIRLQKRNERIEVLGGSKEIQSLIESYNSMVDELESSAVKLAKSEREYAWREMAKQVAHEIKNPLTPMRLTVQSFERKFDPSDPDIKNKLTEYSQTLIQQIDVMSSIASAFSDFAKMPAGNNKQEDIVEVVSRALDLFPEKFIVRQFPDYEIFLNIDKVQITRVITNLVKNAIQALEEATNPEIIVRLKDETDDIKITVSDNGIGISEQDADQVFEPKFTTKTSGMGLGLPMVKNIIDSYAGTITFESEENKGTIFTITLPKL